MTDNMKRQLFTGLALVLSLIIVAWIAVTAVQSVEAKPDLCKEGIYEEPGSDQIFQSSDRKRVDKFIEKTGVHLYVHSLTEVFFKADTYKEYEEVYLRSMQQACTDDGYALPGGVLPRRTIFVVFGGTYNDQGILFPTPALAASDDIAKEVDAVRCKFYAQFGSYGPGYATSSLNAFLDSLQPLLA